MLKAASRKRTPDDVDDDAEENGSKPKRKRAPKAKTTAVKAKSAPKTPAEAHVPPSANAAPEPSVAAEPSEAAEPSADGSAGDPQPKKKPGKPKEDVDLALVFAEKD